MLLDIRDLDDVTLLINDDQDLGHSRSFSSSRFLSMLEHFIEFRFTVYKKGIKEETVSGSE